MRMSDILKDETLKHPSAHIRSLAVKNADSFSEETIESVLSDEEVVKQRLIERHLWWLTTRSQIELAFKEKNPHFKCVWVKKIQNPLLEDIERALNDSESLVRYSMANREDIQLTQAQIERGLLDVSESVVAAILEKQETVITKEIVSKFFEKHKEILLKRMPFSPPKECVDMILKPGQNRMGNRIRRALFSRSDLVLTTEQVDIALEDEDDERRSLFVKNYKNGFTKEQINKALKSNKFPKTQSAMVKNRTVSFDEKEIDSFVRFRSTEVLMAFVTRDDLKISEKSYQIAFDCFPTREYILKRTDENRMILNAKQVEDVISYGSVSLILPLLKRTDDGIMLSEEQAQRVMGGLNKGAEYNMVDGFDEYVSLLNEKTESFKLKKSIGHQHVTSKKTRSL